MQCVNKERNKESELVLYVVSTSPQWPTMLNNLKFDHCMKIQSSRMAAQTLVLKSAIKTEAFQHSQRSFMPTNTIKNNGDANYTE